MYRPSPRGPGLGPQGQPNGAGMPGGQFNPPPSAGNPPGAMAPQPQLPGSAMGGFRPVGYPQASTPTPSSPSVRPMGFGGGPPRGPPVGGMQSMSLGPGQQASPQTGQAPHNQGFLGPPNVRPGGFSGPPGVRPGGFPGPGAMPGVRPPSSSPFPGSPGGPRPGHPGGGGFGGFPGARPDMPPASGAPMPGGGQFPHPGQAPGMGQFPGMQRPAGPPSGPVGQQPGMPGRPMMMGPPSAPGPGQFSQPMGGPQHPRPPGPPGPPGAQGFFPPPGPPGPGGMAPQMTAPRPNYGQGMERPQSPSSRIDPNQIPRPELNAKTQAVPFLTRDKNQHQSPPQACSKFVTKDMGNCSPHHIRLSLNNVPTTNELAAQVTVPLLLFTQPLALPNVEEDPIQVVDFGEDGPVRCARCRAYINPFFQFQDGGRTFQCTLCGVKNETPANYFCYLGPDGRRRDADERPELCKGTVEFAAPSSFSVRPPMPPTHLFLVDVSYQAVTSGAMHIACNTIKRVLDSIQGGSRAMAGIATFDVAMHFYGLKSPEASPQMLVISDISEAFAPVPNTLLVPVQEYKDGLLAILDLIPQMFSSQKVADSCAGVAIEAAIEVLKGRGGKLHCILSSRPSKGLRALQQRDTTAVGAEKAEKEKQTVLIPQDNTYRTLAIRAADHQVCVDMFFLSQAYMDVATLSTLCQTTGGSIYRYAPFQPQYDEDQFVNDLRWNLTRPQGLEAVLRVRCSEGLDVESYLGSCYLRTQTDVDLPAVDCDKSIMVKIKHDDKLQEGAEAVFQSALLYTSTSGQRRIRVNTMAVNITSNVSQVFRGADLECYLNFLARKTSISMAGSTLNAAKEAVTNACVGVLHAYRKYCATPMTSTGQLILPDALKLLPLYALAFLKSSAIRSDVRPDERAAFFYSLYCLPCSKILPLLYPRFVDISTLKEQKDPSKIIPPSLPLSSENLKEGRLYLLENGGDLLLKVESNVSQECLKELFGIDRVNVREEEPRLLISDSPFNKAVHAMVNEMRKERSSYMKLRVALRSQPFEQKFLNLLVEDRSAAGMSYVEYLCHVHRCIQGKMN